MFATDHVLYTFPNRSSDCDEIWYGDILDLGKEDGLHFVGKKGKQKVQTVEAL